MQRNKVAKPLRSAYAPYTPLRVLFKTQLKFPKGIQYSRFKCNIGMPKVGKCPNKRGLIFRSLQQ